MLLTAIKLLRAFCLIVKVAVGRLKMLRLADGNGPSGKADRKQQNRTSHEAPNRLVHIGLSESEMQIGILFPNWVGDVVMATPMLRTLHRKFGHEAEITGIMKRYVADVLSGLPWLDHVLYYDSGAEEYQYRFSGVVDRLRARRLDWFFLLPNSLRAGAMAWFSGARRRVGYVRNSRGVLLNHRIYPPRQQWKLTPISAVDYYLDLAYAAGCPAGSRHVELATVDDDERRADWIWHRLGLARAEQVVIFNTGGAYGTAKNWPVEYFAELARRITDQTDSAVLVVCGPAERTTADEIERSANRPLVKSLAKEELGLGLTKAFVRRSDLVVSTDSGPRHFAAAFGVPAVTLFGPTDQRWSINYHPREMRIQHDVPCGPCGQRTCPLVHHKCMRELSLSRVFAAIKQQLATRAPAKAA